MQFPLGLDAGKASQGVRSNVVWDTRLLPNQHVMVMGTTGAGKTHTLRKMIEGVRSSSQGRGVRIHVFDVHGDIDIPGADSVVFSEQSPYGLNPLKISADPASGGVRRAINDFISTVDKSSRQPLGDRQRAVVRNLLLDLFRMQGFDADDPSTWLIRPNETTLVSTGSDDRLYLDPDEGQISAIRGSGGDFDDKVGAWWVRPRDYTGKLTEIRPKRIGRTYPTVDDAAAFTHRLVEQCYLGSDQQAVTSLQEFNKRVSTYQRKLIDRARAGRIGNADPDDMVAIELAADKATKSFQRYVESIRTGHELQMLLRYDDLNMLRSLSDRFDTLRSSGVFKKRPPPFDAQNAVWRYDLRNLSAPEKKMFVLFALNEIYQAGIRRGKDSGHHDILVLDESARYFDTDPDNILAVIAREGRKFGLHLWCAAQGAGNFTDEFIALVSTKIVLKTDAMHWPALVKKLRLTTKMLQSIQPKHTFAVHMQINEQPHQPWLMVSSQTASQSAPRIAAVG